MPIDLNELEQLRADLAQLERELVELLKVAPRPIAALLRPPLELQLRIQKRLTSLVLSNLEGKPHGVKDR